jgi:hypothetical protein
MVNKRIASGTAITRTCYHPLFVFNQFGDLKRCALRPDITAPTHGTLCSSPSRRDIKARFRASISGLMPASQTPRSMSFSEWSGSSMRSGCQRTFAAVTVRLQLHALADNLGNFLRTLATPEPDQGLVADKLEGKADQDRREGRQPRPLCRLPDGRGRHPTANVPGDSAAHPGTAGAATTCASVRRSKVMQSRATEERSAFKCQGKWPDQRLGPSSRRQSISNRPHSASGLSENPKNRYRSRQIRSHPGNPGLIGVSFDWSNYYLLMIAFSIYTRIFILGTRVAR